jgi:hypothetical protein
MEIEVKNESTLLWMETKEYDVTIDGKDHTFRVYDSMHESPLYWFDDIPVDYEEEVLKGLTVCDLLECL